MPKISYIHGYEIHDKKAHENIEGLCNDVKKIKSTPFVSVRDFGAVGDGVTDDTSAFTLAAASGKNIYVPMSNNEVYLITDTINVEKNNQIWASDATHWRYDLNNQGHILFTGANSLFYCTGNCYAFRNIAATSTNNEHSVFVTIVNENADSDIIGNTIYNFKTGVSIDGRGCRIRDNYFGNIGYGVDLRFTFDRIGNIWQTPETGFRSFDISRNKFHTCTNACIRINSNHFYGSLISGNIYDGGGQGNFVNVAANISGLDVLHNECIGNMVFLNCSGTELNNINVVNNKIHMPYVNMYSNAKICISFGSAVLNNVNVSANQFVNMMGYILYWDVGGMESPSISRGFTFNNNTINNCATQKESICCLLMSVNWMAQTVITGNNFMQTYNPENKEICFLRNYGGAYAEYIIVNNNSLPAGCKVTYSLTQNDKSIIQSF